ncbi:MAG: hypothetical protein QM736_28900 [Vicinamibacterales bacterium]
MAVLPEAPLQRHQRLGDAFDHVAQRAVGRVEARARRLVHALVGVELVDRGLVVHGALRGGWIVARHAHALAGRHLPLRFRELLGGSVDRRQAITDLVEGHSHLGAPKVDISTDSELSMAEK